MARPIPVCPFRSEPDALFQDLLAALHTLPADIYAAPAPARLERETLVDETIRVGTAAEGATIKEGSYLVVKDRLAQIVDGMAVAVPIRNGKGSDGIPARHARIIRGLVQIRDAVRAVLRAQEADLPWGGAQVRLRAAYAHFKREFGPINLTTISETAGPDGEVRETVRRPNLQPFLDDPDVWLVASIEDYDVETGVARQGPIFTERVLHPPVTPEVTSAADALAVALHETGVVDLDRVAELLGVTREAAIAELGNRIFLDPQAWRARASRPGGPPTPISPARSARSSRSPSTPRSRIRDLSATSRRSRTLSPEDLKPSEITARLGAPWIPADVVAGFCEEILGVTTRVYHTVEIASWTIEVNAFLRNPASTTDWGTLRRHAGELVSDALNSTLPQIYDTFIEDGVEKRVLNAADTEAAKDKLAKIKQAFEAWIWTDTGRADRLAKIYNERFNNLVPRRFDGSHLTIPGASSVIRFYEHQKRAIWRILSAGSTYVAHAVGAGKTFTLAAAVMEQKRLGLITKPMMTVPGHCLAQAAREFLQLYPTANILVADETNFVKDKRQRFLARAATANWDCIIITHSAFKFIPAPADFERALISDVIGSYVDLLDRVDAEDRVSRKRIERMKEGMEARLEALKARKDDLLTIAEIGVDQVIVDEMQEFRKLTFTTNQSTLKGVDPDGSQRAWDLYVKARFLGSKRAPMRALIAASGTPITNTLGEMFTIQRFFQPEMLAERGIQEFDAWAAAFGETTTDLELQPSGLYKPVTRFAEFVNIPELIAMFRDFADVVLQSELRQNLKLPRIAGGQRQVIAVPASPAFKAYQRVLAQRIKAIEQRQRKPQKGDDILLSVITDGRHAAIDLRFVNAEQPDEPENKLNTMIAKVFEIWRKTSDRRYFRPDGAPDPIPGATQMVFSDLGTPSVAEARGFSAYLWAREKLIALGVPCVRDRLHAGPQALGRQAAPLQRHERRQEADPHRLVRDHGHRRQRPQTARRAPPSRRAVAPVPGRPARRPDRAPGQPERRDRALRLCDQGKRRRHRLADARAQGALHRHGHVGRSVDPADRRRRSASQSVRSRQGDRIRRPAPDPEGGPRGRDRPPRAPAGQSFRRADRDPPQDRPPRPRRGRGANPHRSDRVRHREAQADPRRRVRDDGRRQGVPGTEGRRRVAPHACPQGRDREAVQAAKDRRRSAGSICVSAGTCSAGRRSSSR